MNFKVFAAFFVTLLAVTASSQSPIKDDSIKEIVVTVLNKVLTETASLLDKANVWVSDLDQNKEDIKNDIVKYVVDEAQKLNVDIIALIGQLKDGATDDGKAVVDCIEAEQTQTDAAFEKGANVVGNCLVAEVDVVLPEVQTILSQLNDLQVDVQGQTDTLSACSGGELVCLVAFGTTIVETAKKIPAVFEEDIDAIFNLIQTIVDDVKACDILPSIKTDIQNIFNEAVVCIKN